jgi:hypothetical protein
MLADSLFIEAAGHRECSVKLGTSELLFSQLQLAT